MLIRLSSRTAICRGAVFRGFINGSLAGKTATEGFIAIGASISIMSPIDRASTGSKYYTHWDETKNPEDKKWDREERKYIARNQMLWRIRKLCDHLAIIQIVLSSLQGRQHVENKSCSRTVLQTLGRIPEIHFQQLCTRARM